LGERELDVMGVLWELGSGTVAEVRDRLPATLAYTTVLTILRTLAAMGFENHVDVGMAHRYLPVGADTPGRGCALARLVDRLFNGSAELLVAQLVRDRARAPDELARRARRLRADDGGEGAP
jgi:predicted transcriptional regulator